MPVVIYDTGHVHSSAVCRPFADGCQGQVVLTNGNPTTILPGDVVVYGGLRGNNGLVSQANAKGQRWWLIDRGYFKASRGGDYSGYFRVTANALQHDGTGEGSPQRFAALGLQIKPWRRAGAHVLVCPQTDKFGELWGFSMPGWLDLVISELKRSTDREIRVRTKQSKAPFSADLADAWAVVAHSSNTAVEALLAGVPVFCTDACAAFAMGNPDVTQIESPKYPDDRERWAAALAANQFLLTEFRNGLAWRMLNG